LSGLDFMKLKILITGGSGLLALNWACAVRDSYSVILGLHERNVALEGVITKYVNLDSVDSILDHLKDLQPDAVIHTVALTSIEQCESNPILARRLNVSLASNMARACSIFKVPFVHISTDHLFSGVNMFTDEISPPSPINVYAKTKAEAELRVLQENPESLVIRTNFYGWGTSYRKSFSDFILTALRAGSDVELFEDVFYTPILAEILAKSVHDLISLKSCGIYNVVGHQRISKYEFGLMLAREFDLNAELIKPTLISDKSFLVKRPNDMSLSTEKIVTLFGRDLGPIENHISRLHNQEKIGQASELEKK